VVLQQWQAIFSQSAVCRQTVNLDAVNAICRIKLLHGHRSLVGLLEWRVIWPERAFPQDADDTAVWFYFDAESKEEI
jgi:hypothetical protein